MSSAGDGGKPARTKELSGREQQILGLAAAGLIDKDISAELGISVNTLRTYWARIRQKYGHVTRSALSAAYAKGQLAHGASKSQTLNPKVLLEETDDPDTLRRAAIYYATAFQRVTDIVRKADRAYRVLSAWPSLAYLAKSEADLIRSVCSVLVEAGGYMIALVGIAEHDTEKSIRVVGSYGDLHGYLDEVRVNWSDNPRGQGPAGKAIRTGQTQVVQDFLADPRTAPWRAVARRAGVQSSVTLPLKDESRVYGLLATYASEPDAFDENETRLLEGVASDFAIRLAEFRKGKSG